MNLIQSHFNIKQQSLLFRAGETFCQMACGMLTSIGDFLRMGTDEIVKNICELSDSEVEEDMAPR